MAALEGTVCSIGETEVRYRDLRSGIKQMYPQHKVTQVNTVFHCLENYHKDLIIKTQVYYHVILTNQTNNKETQRSRVRKKPDIAAEEPKVDPVTECGNCTTIIP